jgi:hypothetical protein
MADDVQSSPQTDALAAPGVMPPPQDQTMMPAGQTLAPPLGTPPIVPSAIQGSIDAGQTTQMADQQQLPPRPIGTSAAGQPKNKAEFFRNMLGDFFYSVGTGLANRGSGPGADARGAGAALTALPERDIQRQQIGIQQQNAQAAQALKEAQADQYTRVPVSINGQTMMLPATAAKQILAAQAAGQSGIQKANIGAGAKVAAAQIGQGMPVAVPQELQDQFGVPAQMPLKQLNALETAANKPLTTVQGATDAYLVNKQTQAKTALGVGSGRIAATMARPVQVADPDNPGGVKYMPAGEAMRTGAPAASSAQVSVPKGVMKDFTSGTSAKTLNSFNTATEHLKLLSQLGDALDNGAVPLINRIANQYSTATGESAPTSFDMAKQAVAGEVAKTFKGQATEGEIAAINTTLNNAQSPKQLKGAIGTALSLMESKRAALMEQYNQGIKNSPAFNKQGGGSVVDKLAEKYGAPK